MMVVFINILCVSMFKQYYSNILIMGNEICQSLPLILLIFHAAIWQTCPWKFKPAWKRVDYDLIIKNKNIITEYVESFSVEYFSQYTIC